MGEIMIAKNPEAQNQMDNEYIKTPKDYLNKELWLKDLMDSYSQDIIWLAYSYVKDADIAEDLTQEVFFKCYQTIDRFRWDSSIRTWLFRITVNKCKDYLRSAYVRRISPTHLISQIVKAKEHSPEMLTIAKDESTILTQSVLALPRKYREVIMLHYFQELKINEIAVLLHLNENTLKTRIRKAKLILKETLGDEIGGLFHGE